MASTSKGTRDLLKRNNIKPTGDSAKDIKVARKLLELLVTHKTRINHEYNNN